MEIKKCEYCSKEIGLMRDKESIIFFCNDDCLQDYCKEYANDSDSYEKEYDDPRHDLD